MEIRKYLNGVSEKDEQAINDFIAKYPKLDEYELLQMVKKELPSTNIVRTFCSIISSRWQQLQKSNLLCWDITVHLENKGFIGARVDKYLIGLILNHIYCEYAGVHEIRELVDNIDNYLKGNDRTFSSFIATLKRTKLGKRNIPYEVLQKQASTETEEIEKLLAQLERLKHYDSNAMADL